MCFPHSNSRTRIRIRDEVLSKVVQKLRVRPSLCTSLITARRLSSGSWPVCVAPVGGVTSIRNRYRLIPSGLVSILILISCLHKEVAVFPRSGHMYSLSPPTRHLLRRGCYTGLWRGDAELMSPPSTSPSPLPLADVRISLPRMYLRPLASCMADRQERNLSRAG